MLDGDIYGLIAPYATANLWVGILSGVEGREVGLLTYSSGGRTNASFTTGTTTRSRPTRLPRRASRAPSPLLGSRPPPLSPC